MSDRQRLRALYQKIPTFECEPGCDMCCGPVPVTAYEAQRTGDVGPLTATDADLKCLHRKAEGCDVYDRRPLLCRMFGAVDTPRMTCPKGRGPARKLTEAEGTAIMREYFAIMGAGRNAEVAHVVRAA